LLRLGIASGQVFGVQACPTRLFLSQSKALCMPHDLTHTGMPEQVWMDWRGLACAPVGRRTQGEHPDICPFGRGLDDLPGAHSSHPNGRAG
jgi:hypothetical protein